MTNINFDPNSKPEITKQQMPTPAVTKKNKLGPASILAQHLDSLDGKQDGKISASVWNEFVKDKGGKTIKYSISIENAEKSISTYLSRNSKADKSKGELAAEWTIKNMDKHIKTSPKENILDTKNMEGLYNPKDPKTIKSAADSVTKFITGKSERYIGASPANAAEVFNQISKNFKGKIPLTMGTHMYLMQLYPALLKQAEALGIKTNYTEDTDFGRGKGMLEVCKNRIKACIDLKNQILAAEKANNKENA